MNIELIKAILHVLDPAVDAPILSEAILPPSEDALQYLAGHAAKCFASDEAKACTLADDSAFLPLLWNIEDDFEKKTAVIAGDWFRVMQEKSGHPRGRRGVSSAGDRRCGISGRAEAELQARVAALLPYGRRARRQ